MGLMNFGLYLMFECFCELKYLWECEYFEKSCDFVFKNMFVDIEMIFMCCGVNGMWFEFECYDILYLYNFVYFVDCGFVKLLFFV